MKMPITSMEVQAAEQRIRPYLPPSPLYEATSLTASVGAPVYAKLEAMQPTGAFKVRGALNALLSLDEATRHKGVVTASGGSHGLGISYAAWRLGVPADVFLGRDTSPAKVAKMRRLGARLHMVGRVYAEAEVAARAYARQTGQAYIHAYADPAVIAGQGTLGLEVLAQQPETAMVIVPVGGGGLITGITVALMSQRPAIRVVAVQPLASNALSRTLAEGVWHATFDYAPTVADGVAGGVGRDVVELARQGVIDQVVDLPEAPIRRAVAWALREEQWLVEGAGALAFAALLEKRVPVAGPVVCVVSGGNIAADTLRDILGEAV